MYTTNLSYAKVKSYTKINIAPQKGHKNINWKVFILSFHKYHSKLSFFLIEM